MREACSCVIANYDKPLSKYTETPRSDWTFPYPPVKLGLDERLISYSRNFLALNVQRSEGQPSVSDLVYNPYSFRSELTL